MRHLVSVSKPALILTVLLSASDCFVNLAAQEPDNSDAGAIRLISVPRAVHLAMPRMSSDGEKMILGRDERVALLWGIHDNTPIAILHGKEKEAVLTSVGFTNADEKVWLAYSDGSVAFFSAVKPEKATYLDCGHRISSAIIDNRGSTILFVSQGSGTVKKYDADKKRVVRLYNKTSGPDIMKFRSAERTFALAGLYWASAWRYELGEPLWRLEYEGEKEPLAFTPDGKGLMFFDTTNPDFYLLRILDGATGKSLWSAKVEAHVNCGCFSADGKLFVSGDDDGRLVVRRIADGKPIAAWRLEKEQCIRSVDADAKLQTVCARLAFGAVIIAKMGNKEVSRVPMP